MDPVIFAEKLVEEMHAAGPRWEITSCLEIEEGEPETHTYAIAATERASGRQVTDSLRIGRVAMAAEGFRFEGLARVALLRLDAQLRALPQG